MSEIWQIYQTRFYMPGRFQICQISEFWHIIMPPGKPVLPNSSVKEKIFERMSEISVKREKKLALLRNWIGVSWKQA